MAAGNGQLNGSTFGARKIWPAIRARAASNFKAGERGKGKEGMPAYHYQALPTFRVPTEPAAKVGIDNFKSFPPRELRFRNFLPW